MLLWTIVNTIERCGRSSTSTTVGWMKIDPADLIDAHEVAEILGLATNRAVSTYRQRYEDFPGPALEKGSGKCILWVRADVERWARARGR